MADSAPPTIAHLDMDSFYVSVERLLDPSLEGKPVVVGGTPDGRGVVASASYEARAFGVRSAMPSAHALRLCPQLVFIHGDLAKYAEHSRRVRDVLSGFTPVVEMASQDEAYLDLTGTERLWGSPPRAAGRIRDAVRERTGLPCSIGVATRKHIAKIASALCKPRGLLWVPSGSERAFLAPLPAGRMPGIGPKAQERLASLGIKTLGQLQQAGPGALESAFGAHAESIRQRALGESGAVLDPDSEAKSISHETTFEEDIADAGQLRAVVWGLAEKVAARLRAAGVHASTIVLKYRYAGFETHTASRTLGAATQDDRALAEACVEMLEAKRDKSRPIRLLGVGASGLCGDAGQLDLLAGAESDPRGKRVAAALDAIRGRHGFKAIGRAGSRDPSRGQWG